MSSDLLQRSLLSADIGATNARFRWSGVSGARAVTLATRDFATTDKLLSAALDALAPADLEAACLAIAGPVADGSGSITNGSIEFVESALSDRLKVPVLLINDFHAQAMALPHLREPLQMGGQAESAGTRVVMGPGSGLGVGVLLPLGERWQVLPSEGGHADLAAGSLLELEVLTLLHQRFHSVSWETVLSGPGLINLYRCVCTIWGGEAQELSAEAISERGLDATDPVCHQTLEMFLGWLGAAAGNLALTFCARGGVYVAGGIVPQWRDFVADSPLRRRFDERAGLADYVQDIPLYLVTETDSGLRGAQAALEAYLDD